jgi:hypothetical protein
MALQMRGVYADRNVSWTGAGLAAQSLGRFALSNHACIFKLYLCVNQMQRLSLLKFANALLAFYSVVVLADMRLRLLALARYDLPE